MLAIFHLIFSILPPSDGPFDFLQVLQFITTVSCHCILCPQNFYYYFSHPMRNITFVVFSLVVQSCPTLSDSMDCSTPGFPVHHQLPELTQTHTHRVGDAIQPSQSLSSPSPPAFNLSQHQDLFQWVSSSHQVAKILELQLQHQSFQWIFRTDL